ncbi:MAG TPA: hypothetical protein QF572_20560 [Vicinamibacterales bacterium]|jgi:hypothetical protein|nr:hypothetical protein [Vicinamibacterales bacterium]
MDRWVRALRGPKTPPSAWEPIRVLHEQERRPGGGLIEVTTVFLAGMECPFSCVFCDLWQQTLVGSTPPASLPRQLELALEGVAHRSLVKLYNASNFFDSAAVPRADEDAMLELLQGFECVTVECHPRFVGDRCFAFADRIDGALEVAIGLETVHPDALPRLNKKMTLADFDACAARLRNRQIGLRAFVLLGCPFIAASEQLDWTLRSVDHAARCGASTISIIPVRGGNGALESLATAGSWAPICLDLVEEVLERALRLDLAETVVQVDLWDIERLAGCRECVGARRARLDAMNRSAHVAPRIRCSHCAGGATCGPL